MSDFQSADLQERTRNKSNARDATDAPEKQGLPRHPVVELQRHLGNAHVARMMAQRSGGAEEDELQAKHDTSVQRSEAAEEEGEELQARHDHSVRRSEAPEEEELQAKHEPSLQRESEQTIGLEGGPVGPEMSSAINSARGGGTALAEGVRSAAESTMGTDFSGVRVHQDSRSDQLNRSMTAKAFTTGSDIFLRGDQNSSDTSLMAHELTHVVQQATGAVGGGGDGMTVGAADDAHEHDADAVAQQVVAGAPQRKQEESPAS